MYFPPPKSETVSQLIVTRQTAYGDRCSGRDREREGEQQQRETSTKPPPTHRDREVNGTPPPAARKGRGGAIAELGDSGPPPSPPSGPCTLDGSPPAGAAHQVREVATTAASPLFFPGGVDHTRGQDPSRNIILNEARVWNSYLG